MRPTTSLTIHAILAAALVALAASSAAAGPAYMKFEPIKGDSNAKEDHRDEIEILSYSWGSSQAAGRVSKVDGFTVKQGVKPEQGGEKGGTEDINIGVGELQENAARAGSGGGQGSGKVSVHDISTTSATASGGVSVAAGDITGDGASSASGLPTGKRAHKPVTLSKPAGKGTVWVRVASPWSGCRVGDRYPSLTLADGAKSHVLHDVSVANCGNAAAGAPTEEVAFYYNRIAFNY
ncbi:type VI secretion system tube protein Hcp [Sphingomonas sp. NSE70-1]|uniref:Type VI secretion system tube protein Hcp n=1 Tax=Sphingomonas caseinilyticus TaxID=2908205 RepID=A0ABT0RX33_9SPHN|nr:type VI secretion system tube protein Hcp [Sphingomonas caseinilyticus]MCL6699590.1 type VI secretion system tube protein Hcp [Sphingomonas caseinilyticus]